MYKILHNLLLLVTLTAITSTNTQAKDISYDYVQGYYGTFTDSSLNIDVDGTLNGIKGSLDVSPYIALTADYSATTFDRFNNINLIVTDLTFGITGHFEISTNTDIAANFSALMSDIEASDGINTFSDDDTGNSLDISVRHKASDILEIDVGLTYVSVYDDSSFDYRFGLWIYPIHNIALGVGYESNDDGDIDAFLISARIEM